MVSTDQRARNFFIPGYIFPGQCTLKLITLTLWRARGAQYALPLFIVLFPHKVEPGVFWTTPQVFEGVENWYTYYQGGWGGGCVS